MSGSLKLIHLLALSTLLIASLAVAAFAPGATGRIATFAAGGLAVAIVIAVVSRGVRVGWSVATRCGILLGLAVFCLALGGVEALVVGDGSPSTALMPLAGGLFALSAVFVWIRRPISGAAAPGQEEGIERH